MIEKWGHDFRPDYKFLGAMKGMFPEVSLNEKKTKGRKGGEEVGWERVNLDRKCRFGWQGEKQDGNRLSRMCEGGKQHGKWKNKTGSGKVAWEVEK